MRGLRGMWLVPVLLQWLHVQCVRCVRRWHHSVRLGLSLRRVRSMRYRNDANWNRWYLQLYSLRGVWLVPVLLQWLHMQRVPCMCSWQRAVWLGLWLHSMRGMCNRDDSRQQWLRVRRMPCVRLVPVLLQWLHVQCMPGMRCGYHSVWIGLWLLGLPSVSRGYDANGDGRLLQLHCLLDRLWLLSVLLQRLLMHVMHCLSGGVPTVRLWMWLSANLL